MAKKILMIEDDQDFIDAVTVLLETRDYQVSYANNGQDGIAKAKEVQPDLITLDVMMADDSEGINVSKALSQDETLKNIPIILVSGIKKVDRFAYDYETGEQLIPVKAFIEKPIDPEKFLETVEKFIG